MEFRSIFYLPIVLLVSVHHAYPIQSNNKEVKNKYKYFILGTSGVVGLTAIGVLAYYFLIKKTNNKVEHATTFEDSEDFGTPLDQTALPGRLIDREGNVYLQGGKQNSMLGDFIHWVKEKISGESLETGVSLGHQAGNALSFTSNTAPSQLQSTPVLAIGYQPKHRYSQYGHRFLGKEHDPLSAPLFQPKQDASDVRRELFPSTSSSHDSTSSHGSNGDT